MIELLRTKLLLLVLLFLSLNLRAQNEIIDSLKQALKNAKHDTTKCNILSEMIEAENEDKIWAVYNNQLLEICKNQLNEKQEEAQHRFYTELIGDAYYNNGILADNQGDNSKALEDYNLSLKFYKEINSKKGLANVFNNMGAIFDNKGDTPKAIEYYLKSLKINEEVNNKNGIATSLNNIGYIYSNQGNIAQALDYYHRCLKIQEDINDKVGISTSLNNIGLIYSNQGEVSKALEYYRKSLKIREGINHQPGIASSLNNIGLIYFGNREFSKALEYFIPSLKIFGELNNQRGLAFSLGNIGLVYEKLGDLTKALEFHYKSLQIQESLAEKGGIAISLNNISAIYFIQGKYKEAINASKRSLIIAKEIGYPSIIKTSAKALKRCYKKQNKFEEAFLMYELEIQMGDSINNTETKKASIKKQFQYQYEKKAAADSVKNAEEQKVKNAQLTAQHAQLKQERTQRFALYGGLLLVIAFSGFVFNRFKVTQKQKKIIEEQKHEVDGAYEKLHEKNKEVMDSIHYAARIQRSLITSEKYIALQLRRLRKL